MALIPRVIHVLAPQPPRSRRARRANKARSRRSPAGMVVEGLEDRRMLSTYTVTSTLDDGSAGTLRYEINLANTAGGDNTINFSPTAFATPQTITLSLGDLSLTDQGALTITGPAAGVTINGGGTSNFTYLGGVFEVATGATASLSSLTITNGYAEGGGGVFINNGASATFTDCTISGNSTVEDGAGILCVGNVVLVDSTVSGNSTPAAGGGLVLDASTDSATLINTTVSGNSAGYFGGIVALGDTTIANSIVAGNTSPVDPDTEGQFFSEGGNLIGAVANSSGWTSSDLTGTVAKPLDPLLAPLGNYGGPTQTMALLPGSPAIDAGSNALIPSGTTTDQRGLPRIVNGTVDIGAFESSGFSIAATSGSGQTAGVFAPLVVTVTANNPNEPVAGGQITFTPPGSGASAFVTDNPATIGTSGTASGTARATVSSAATRSRPGPRRALRAWPRSA